MMWSLSANDWEDVDVHGHDEFTCVDCGETVPAGEAHFDDDEPFCESCYTFIFGPVAE